MDFGLSGLSKEIERHFGRAWAKAYLLVLLSGLAIIVGGLAYDRVAVPLAVMLGWSSPRTLAESDLWAWGNLIVFLLGFVTIVSLVSQVFKERRYLLQLEDELEQSRLAIARIEETRDQATGLLASSRELNNQARAHNKALTDTVNAAVLIVQQMIERGRDQGTLSDDQVTAMGEVLREVDRILVLRDVELATSPALAAKPRA